MRPALPRSILPAVVLIPLLLHAVGVPADAAVTTSFTGVPEVPPAWSLELESAVLWQHVTSLGTLILDTSSRLAGVDPATGGVLWERTDLGGLAADRFQEIAGTPFVVISDAEAKRVVILDSMTGKGLLDSRQAGFAQVFSSHVLPGAGALLVVGAPAGKVQTVLSLYDIASGTRRWTNESIISGATGALSTLLQAMTGKSIEYAAPIELDASSFLFGSGTAVDRIDTQSGKVVWQASSYGNRLWLGPRERDIVVTGGQRTTSLSSGGESVQSFYQAFRVSDGGEIWTEPVQLDGSVNDVLFLAEGILLSPRTSGKGKVKLVDYADGSSLWGPKGKGLKIAGGVVGHAATDAGLVLITGYDSAWTNKGTEYFLNIVDPVAGALRFEDGVKVEGRILATEVLGDGLLYRTTSEMNVLDIATGELRHRPGVRSEDSLVTAEANGKVYAYSRDAGQLYVLDKATGNLRQLSQQKVMLEGKDEVPFSLEVTPEAFLVASNQNLVSFRPDGALNFHVHYPAPAHPAWVRALMVAESVRAGMAAAASGMSSAAFAGAAAEQDDGTLGRALTTEVARGYGEMAEGYAGLSQEYARASKQRFHASAESPDHVFMMVQFSKKEVGLAKVSKRTGTIEAVINMQKDRTPSYEVDGIGRQIYYQQNPAEVQCYRFGSATTPTAAARTSRR